MDKEPITQETIRKIQKQMNEIFASLSGTADYKASIQMLQAATREMPSIAAFSRDAAQGLMPEATRGNTVYPELFGQYLAEIDTEEKCNSVLAGMTESEGQQLSRYLTEMMKVTLPGMREAGLDALKQLPRRRGGGRPKEIDEERAERICKKIAKHIENGLRTGDAQRRVAAQEGISERAVREAWQNRKKKQMDHADDE